MTKKLAETIKDALTAETIQRSRDGYSASDDLFDIKIHRGNEGQILLDIELEVMDLLDERFAHEARADLMRDLSHVKAGSFCRVRQNEVTDHGVTLHRYSARSEADIVKAINQVLSPSVAKLDAGQGIER